MRDYTNIEAGYTREVIAIAREVIGEDALAGVGYGQDYRVALRAVRLTEKVVRARLLAAKRPS